MPDRQPPKPSARATGRTSFAAHELAQAKEPPTKDRTAFSASELNREPPHPDAPLRDQDNVQMRPKPRGISLDHPRRAPTGMSGIKTGDHPVEYSNELLIKWYQERRSVAADKTASSDDRHVNCCEADDMLKDYPHMREAFENYDKQAARHASIERGGKPTLNDRKPNETRREFTPLATGQSKDRGIDR